MTIIYLNRLISLDKYTFSNIERGEKSKDDFTISKSSIYFYQKNLIGLKRKKEITKSNDLLKKIKSYLFVNKL